MAGQMSLGQFGLKTFLNPKQVLLGQLAHVYVLNTRENAPQQQLGYKSSKQPFPLERHCEQTRFG